MVDQREVSGRGYLHDAGLALVKTLPILASSVVINTGHCISGSAVGKHVAATVVGMSNGVICEADVIWDMGYIGNKESYSTLLQPVWGAFLAVQAKSEQLLAVSKFECSTLVRCSILSLSGAIYLLVPANTLATPIVEITNTRPALAIEASSLCFGIDALVRLLSNTSPMLLEMSNDDQRVFDRGKHIKSASRALHSSRTTVSNGDHMVFDRGKVLQLTSWPLKQEDLVKDVDLLSQHKMVWVSCCVTLTRHIPENLHYVNSCSCFFDGCHEINNTKTDVLTWCVCMMDRFKCNGALANFFRVFLLSPLVQSRNSALIVWPGDLQLLVEWKQCANKKNKKFAHGMAFLGDFFLCDGCLFLVLQLLQDSKYFRGLHFCN